MILTEIKGLGDKTDFDPEAARKTDKTYTIF